VGWGWEGSEDGRDDRVDVVEYVFVAYAEHAHP
jgi:hypothetical protein